MDCNEYQEQISQFLDRELPADATPGMFAHLSVCTRCREFMQATLSVRSALASEPDIPLPEELDERFAARFSRGRKIVRFRVTSITDMIKARMYVPVPAAIMGALLLLFSLLLSTSLAIRSGSTVRPAEPTIYIMSLSTIEVEGHVNGPAK